MPNKRTYLMLTLIRSGETSWDESARLRGRSNLPLSEPGRAAVQHDLARPLGLAFKTVYHPPDDAATQTAHLAAAVCSARTRESQDLSEPDLGLLEGLTRRQFAERHPKRCKQWDDDPLALVPPEGEPLAEARARLLAEVARLVRRARAPELAIVLHPLALGMLRCWLADRPARELNRLLKDRPRIERYVITLATVRQMHETAMAMVAGT